MTRIRPVDHDAATPAGRAAYDDVVRGHGRITNMKRTLLHSMPAFRALMEWYPLRDTVQPFLGERLTIIFAHVISADTDCLICTTFMRRIIIDSGEDPDSFALDEREQLVVDFGRCLAAPYSRVPDDFYARLSAEFTDEQIREYLTRAACHGHVPAWMPGRPLLAPRRWPPPPARGPPRSPLGLPLRAARRR